MFRPFLVRPSSGWIHLLEELYYNTIQYNQQCRVSGGDEILFTNVKGCVVHVPVSDIFHYR